MKPEELIENAKITLSVLQRKDVSAILAKHPDVDWEIEINPTVFPKVRLNGFILLSTVRKELEIDITEIANLVSSTNWNYANNFTLFEDNEVLISNFIDVSQPLQPEEKELLRALGHIKTIPTKTHLYETIVCEK